MCKWWLRRKNKETNKPRNVSLIRQNPGNPVVENQGAVRRNVSLVRTRVRVNRLHGAVLLTSRSENGTSDPLFSKMFFD